MRKDTHSLLFSLLFLASDLANKASQEIKEYKGREEKEIRPYSLPFWIQWYCGAPLSFGPQTDKIS